MKEREKRQRCSRGWEITVKAAGDQVAWNVAPWAGEGTVGHGDMQLSVRWSESDCTWKC